MNRRRRLATAISVLLGALLLPCAARAQLVLGQYEDEAPLGSWNSLGIALGPSLACGGVRIAAAWDASTALVNPSLLFGLPRTTATLSGSFLSASLRKYSILNTGVLGTTSNFSQGVYALEFAGISVRTGNWALAAGAGVMESYDRPHLEYNASDQGVSVYSIKFDQGGWLKVYNLAAARRISRRLAFGLGINAVSGKINRSLTEDYPADGIVILDSRNQSLRGVFANAGLTWTPSDRLSFSAMFRTPYDRKAKARSLLEYTSRTLGTDIRIEASATDEYHQPWVAGGGVSWRPAKNLRVMSDLALFKWSSYRMTYFDESKIRSFRDIVTLGAGLEYDGTYRLFGRDVRAPLRAGIMIDPQPMSAPRSTYYAFTFGGGFAVGRFRLDLAGAIGRESGSGDALAVRRVAVSLTYVQGD
jgi:hypothetical protein